MKIISLIRNIDFLGNDINFSINNNDTFPTILGGFISFILYFLYIWLFSLFAEDLIYRKSPTGYTKHEPYFEGPIPQLNITDTSFFAGIQLQDNLSRVIDPQDLLFPLFNYHSFIFDKEKGKYKN